LRVVELYAPPISIFTAGCSSTEKVSQQDSINMLVTSVLALAFAATGFAQAPEGYKTVYITSMVNTKFVVAAKAAAAGSTLIVCVGPIYIPVACYRILMPFCSNSLAKLLAASQSSNGI
jgi:hypothetical protein